MIQELANFVKRIVKRLFAWAGKLYLKFQRYYNLPLIGLLLIFIFNYSILNHKNELEQYARQGIAFQLTTGVLLLIFALVKYLIWFFINIKLIDNIILYSIKLFLLVIYIQMLYVFITKKNYILSKMWNYLFDKFF